jgi:septation ring formation regulator EzrA
MRVTVPLFCLLLILGCASHKSEKRQLTPEQLKLAEQASAVATKSDEFFQKAPSDLQAKLSDFNNQAQRFSNTSQRFGAGSLEARNVLDRLRFHAVQLDQQITKQTYPDLFPAWQELRGEIDKIASKLGYRIESQ